MPIGAVGGVPAAAYVPPVGVVLTLGVDTSPAELYPGTTWARIKDRFLWGASDAHPLGETGGSATHTLTVDEMPAHTHTATLAEAGAHTHTFAVCNGNSLSLENWGDDGSSVTYEGKVETSSNGAHTHTVTLTSVGSGKSFSVMNPYAAKSIWWRVS